MSKKPDLRTAEGKAARQKEEAGLKQGMTSWLEKAKDKPKQSIESLRRQAMAETNPMARVGLQEELARRTREEKVARIIDLSDDPEDEKSPPRKKKAAPRAPNLLGPKVQRRDELQAEFRERLAIPSEGGKELRRHHEHAQALMGDALDARSRSQDIAMGEIRGLRARGTELSPEEREAA